MELCLLSWLIIFLVWHDLSINANDWCSVGVSTVQEDLMTSNPNLTSSIHDPQKPLSPSPNSSFQKNNFPGLLSKSNGNHLTNSVLDSEGVIATPLPYFSHHSPSRRPTLPSKSLILLSAESCRNTGDLVGALGHPVGSIRSQDIL